MSLLHRLVTPLVFALVALVGSTVAASAVAAQAVQPGPITLKDVSGRTVVLAKPATRVVLAQARYLPVLGLIHPDPVSILAGWSDEFKTSFANEYAAYKEKFPAIENIPVVGRHTAETFSVEKTLSLRPDLVILTSAFAGIAPGADPQSSNLIRQFDAAGVPVVVVDFFMRPLQNTEPSIRLLGQALGRNEQAEALVSFYRQHMDRVAARTQVAGRAKPPVLVHAHAGSTDCCNSPGVGTFNDMISLAGGHNIGADVLKGATGQLGFEYINSRNPAVYVATGTGATRRAGAGLTIGMDADPERARASLQAVIDSQRLSALFAVRTGNAHGIWHGFNDSPLHVVFIEALARWLDPVAFADVSAQATLDEINTRFAAVPYRGAFMVDLTPAAGDAVPAPNNAPAAGSVTPGAAAGGATTGAGR
ncbi:ABC transporter substrate-binding protein [Alcaligenaceae bacterium C4P045]|nr:ABC transporter substrate-binding protein [Alcaligenaceae bacterium C4P045]